MTQNIFLDSTAAKLHDQSRGAPKVGRGSDTNLSRPICDTILKRLEGPTKDRTAYWNTFARWISLHQHYIIDGDTWKRHTMPHKYNIISYMRTTSDYGWNTNRNLNDIHPASPGCRPGTYPLIEEEAEDELQNKQTSLSRHDHRTTCTCNCCCSNLWVTRTQQSHYHGYQDYLSS